MCFVEEYLHIFRDNYLFFGLSDEEISGMLVCTDARKKNYVSGEYILRRGDTVQEISILAEGRLYIQREDYWGNRSIVSDVRIGEVFGESYALPESGELMNDVVAAESSVVISIDCHKLLSPCSLPCPFHSTVIRNLVSILAGKNRMLVRKIGHLSERTTREKLLSYLSDEALGQKSGSIDIPFSRQQLADYLAVDRSAMSKELGKMRDAGLIETHKNHFELFSSAMNFHKDIDA